MFSPSPLPTGFDFLVTALTHPRYNVPEVIDEPSTFKASDATSEEAPIPFRQWPFTRSDLLLPSSDWGSLLVAVLSRPLGIEAREDGVRRRAEGRKHDRTDSRASICLKCIFRRASRLHLKPTFIRAFV